MKSGKCWGDTSLLLSNGSVELHRVNIRAGAKCSEHAHQSKYNGFLVISGQLKVRVWKNTYSLVDETLLTPGDFTHVAPGEYHQFEAVEDTDAIELYWTALDPNDIQRRSVGTA